MYFETVFWLLFIRTLVAFASPDCLHPVCVVAVLVSSGLEQFYSQIFLSTYPIYISRFAFFLIRSVDYAISKRGQSRVCLDHIC
jgi:hypothetical protein